MNETNPAAETAPLAESLAPLPESPAAGNAAPPAAEPAPPSRPDYLPEKFWDAASGTVRAEALARSYQELERKLGRMVPLPQGEADVETRERLLAALGRPATPDDYRIEAPSELMAPDPAINARLHEAGFTQGQAQLVYELAAEHLTPVIRDVLWEAEAQQQTERLAQHFGGANAWQQVARELRGWGEAHLAPEVFATLAGDAEGVLAMYRMMQAAEPALIEDAAGPRERLDAESLHQMMRDPRYWRDRDPEFVDRVTEGFKALFSA
ncbi:hypothetical protein SH611_03115 [Geminicoccaceae bacterium 1502E]|nr:hypothetical protein [Geminicoccaceae bacterium 1502E]